MRCAQIKTSKTTSHATMPSRWRAAPRIGVLSLALLSGCAAVGPDYERPAQASINENSAQADFTSVTRDPGEATAFNPQPLPDHWWRLYRSPALDHLIEDALEHNTDLRVAEANLKRVQAQRNESRALAQPTVGVNAQPTYGHASGVQTLQPDATPRNRFSYTTGVAVSYTVDLFGQIQRAEEAAQRDVQAAQAALESTRVAVAAETARAFADACTAGMQLAQAQRSVDIQAESVSVTQRLFDAGRGTRLDVTRAQAQVNSLKAALPPYQAQRKIALIRLATLTGRAPAQWPAALAQCNTPPLLTQPIPVGDGAALLARRPDVRQAEHQLAASTARIGVATADLYPKISLGLSAASGGPAALLGDRGTYSWSLGPLISWTIPNTGAAQSRIAQAEASTQAAAAHFDGVVLNALKETESALTQYARQLDRDDALKAARDDSAQAANQAERLYKNGKTDYLTVLDAQRTLAQLDAQWAASRAALVDQQIAIFLALGGGWE